MTTALFEAVRYILIAGFMALGICMFRMVVTALGDGDARAPLRYAGGWIILMICVILAVVTFQVQP